MAAVLLIEDDEVDAAAGDRLGDQWVAQGEPGGVTGLAAAQAFVQGRVVGSHVPKLPRLRGGRALEPVQSASAAYISRDRCIARKGKARNGLRTRCRVVPGGHVEAGRSGTTRMPTGSAAGVRGATGSSTGATGSTVGATVGTGVGAMAVRFHGRIRKGT
jgi:hypothetical protein